MTLLPGRRPRWHVTLGAAVLVVVAALVLRPTLACVYHLEAGGRALDRALGPIDPVDWWYTSWDHVQDVREIDGALAHLEKASSDTQALRLSARAWAAQGDFLKSIRALERFTALRPENPLAHLELAAAYGLADRRLRELEFVDLVAMLPGALVSAPDLQVETTYSPEGWESKYVYPTTFGLPPNYGDRPTLFLHAGAEVTYTVELTQPAVLSYGMGLHPESLGWGGDGAMFEVWVDGIRVFLEHLTVDVAREGWQERSVDLSGYQGRRISLMLATTPGPAGDNTADWAGWGTPRIEAAEAAAYREKVQSRPWLAEWKRGRISSTDFLQAGNTAQGSERYEEALRWYEWMQVAGESSAAFYIAFTEGLLYEKQGLYDQAVSSFLEAVGTRRSKNLPLGTVYYRIGAIQQDRLGQWDAAFQSYGQALEEGSFVTSLDWADTCYKRGVILAYGRNDRPGAQQEFQCAVSVFPNHYGALMELGTGYWELEKDFEKAKRPIQAAIEANPEAPWAYIAMGDLYSASHMFDEALGSYETALELAPLDREIQRRIRETQQEIKE